MRKFDRAGAGYVYRNRAFHNRRHYRRLRHRALDRRSQELTKSARRETTSARAWPPNATRKSARRLRSNLSAEYIRQ
jgi:hypothetical protein